LARLLARGALSKLRIYSNSCENLGDAFLDTTPSPTEELQRYYETSKRSVARVPEEAILLRYTQALQAKWEKYEKYVGDELIAASDCYVVAISGAALPFPSTPGKYGEPPSVAHALYGIGPYRWEIEIGTGRMLEAGWSHRPAAHKPTGATVESDLFLGGKRAGISAVLAHSHFQQGF
jgi:hypothetical protein